MDFDPPPYRPPLALRSGHLQTVLPTLFRRVDGVAYRRERLELDDGDFLDLDWVGWPEAAAVAVVAHGLEGSSDRAYVRGMVRELARRGAVVGLLARREERLREIQAEIETAGGRAAWAEADVTDTDGLHAALDRLAEEIGDPDVVVANAGWNRSETMSRFKPGRAMSIYDTNLFGMLRLIDWALPRFLARGSGHVVGVASMASYFGFPANAAYCGSKAAMRIHLQSLRISGKKRGIAVTTICPGYVESELTDKNSYRMPFLWPTDRAARLMADAIEERRATLDFPWQMKWLVARFLHRLVPRRLAEWAMARGGG